MTWTNVFALEGNEVVGCWIYSEDRATGATDVNTSETEEARKDTKIF